MKKNVIFCGVHNMDGTPAKLSDEEQKKFVNGVQKGIGNTGTAIFKGHTITVMPSPNQIIITAPKLFYLKRKDESYGSYYVVMCPTAEDAIRIYMEQHCKNEQDDMVEYDVEEIPFNTMLKFENK